MSSLKKMQVIGKVIGQVIGHLIGHLIGHQEWVQEFEGKLESEGVEWGLNNNQSLHSLSLQTNLVNPICYKLFNNKSLH